MENVIQILKERGFVEALTDEQIQNLVNTPQKVYCGFDPTSDSLHLGNMVAIMGLAWFQKCGHTPVALVGGATGMIGDPSGKSAERQLLDETTIQQNLAGIRKNLEAVLDAKSANAPVLVNNYDWFKNFSFLSFLREVGKFFRLGPMLSKEMVRTRLQSEEGMSFTEFSYQLLQGYDFYYLYKTHGVKIQLGGSDQWGNITAGIDYIRKILSEQAYGVTFPLLTRSDGQKFGKTEKGAIWLSPERLSPYEFYQHLVRVADADVISLLRMLTFLPMDEIKRLENSMKQSDYVANTAQKRLAEEVTKIVHGEDGIQKALKATMAAAPGSKTTLDGDSLKSIASDIPSYQMKAAEALECKILDLILRAGMVASKSEGRRLIQNGGVYLNNEKIEDEQMTLTPKHLIDGNLLLLAIGKKNKMLICLEF